MLSHYLGQPLSASRHIRIDHATLSILELDGATVSLRLLNTPPELARLP